MALESDIAGYERFQREEEIGAKLNHHAILKVIKVEEQKSRPYLVMEFLAGKTLAEVLSKRKMLSEGRRSPMPARSATPWSTSTRTASPTGTSSRRTSWSARTGACGSSTSASRASRRPAA
jgi:hypothetical protein